MRLTTLEMEPTKAQELDRNERALIELVRGNPQWAQKLYALMASARAERQGQASTDEAEERIVGQLHALGQEAIQGWAQASGKRIAQQMGALDATARVRTKKTPLAQLAWESESAGARVGGPTGSLAAAVLASGVSGHARLFAPVAASGLRFSLEESFEISAKRLCEHHAVELSASTLRLITLERSENRKRAQLAREVVRTLPAQGAVSIVAQADGPMLAHDYCAEGEGGGARVGVCSGRRHACSPRSNTARARITR